MALTLPTGPAPPGGGGHTLALDIRALNALKQGAGRNVGDTREAARQFESLFMNELIKSMRAATLKSGLMDNPSADLGQDLLDQQLALSLSGMPGGLSEAIASQLARQVAGPGRDALAPLAGAPPAAPAPAPAAAAPASKSRDHFVQRLGASAERVARDSGIPASFMLGHAGHETGWGRSEIKTADGRSTFNLFGLKAGKDWTGKVAQVHTTEYIDGAPRKLLARFRAYDSYEESLRDYARLINASPRYAKARAQTGSAMAYAAELQKAGYATDPGYAQKLSGAIASASRVQRARA